MRVFDLAMAGMIGVSSIAVLLAWNPQTTDRASRELVEQAHLRDELTHRVEAAGIPALLDGGSLAFCTTVAGWSNSTVAFSGSFDSIPCGGSPPPSSSSAELSIVVGATTLVMSAWYIGRA
jgi:hypothetical protein